MKQISARPVLGKIAALVMLYAAAVVIMGLGVFFGIYSSMLGIGFRVLNVTIPGAVFGALAA